MMIWNFYYFKTFYKNLQSCNYESVEQTPRLYYPELFARIKFLSTNPTTAFNNVSK